MSPETTTLSSKQDYSKTLFEYGQESKHGVTDPKLKAARGAVIIHDCSQVGKLSNFLSLVRYIGDSSKPQSKTMSEYCDPLMRLAREQSINVFREVSGQEHAEAFLQAVDYQNLQANQLPNSAVINKTTPPLHIQHAIRASIISKFMKNDAPVVIGLVGLLTAGTGIAGSKLSEKLGNNKYLKTIQNAYSDLSPGFKNLLLSSLVPTAMVVNSGKIGQISSNYLKDRVELLSYALGMQSDVPDKVSNIYRFHGLEHEFSENKHKIPESIANDVEKKFLVIRSLIHKNGDPYQYNAINSIEPFAVGHTVYNNITSLLDELQSVISPYQSKDFAKHLLGPELVGKLSEGLEEKDRLVVESILSHLIVPKHEKDSTETEKSDIDYSTLNSVSVLAAKLGDLLNLSKKQVKSLERMISFKQLESKFIDLKMAMAEGQKKVNALMVERDKVAKTYNSGKVDQNEKAVLRDKYENLSKQISQEKPSVSEDLMESIEKLFLMANASLKGHKKDFFDMQTFDKSLDKNQYMKIDELYIQEYTQEDCITEGHMFHISDLTKAIEELMAFAKKPYQTLDLFELKKVEDDDEPKAVLKPEIREVTKYLDDESQLEFEAILKSTQEISQSDAGRALLEVHKKPALLLEGVPGTGKTTLIKNLAKAVGIHMIEVSPHVTPEEFSKAIDKSPVKNPWVFIDEAGEILKNNDAFLNSFLRVLINPDISTHDVIIPGHIPYTQSIDRLTFFMTGNEHPGEDKASDRMRIAYMNKSTMESKKEVALGDYLVMLESEPVLLDDKIKNILMNDFEEKFPKMIGDVQSLRAIKRRAKVFAQQQIAHFSAYLSGARGEPKPRVTREWNANFDKRILPHLLKLNGNQESKPTKSLSLKPPFLVREDSYDSDDFGEDEMKDQFYNNLPSPRRTTSHFLPKPSSLHKRTISREISTGVSYSTPERHYSSSLHQGKRNSQLNNSRDLTFDL